jgi:hypothetical protein
MSIPRQPRGARWLFSQSSTFDILIAGGASIVGFSAAASYASQDRPGSALVVGIATVAILVSSVVKNGLGLAQARKKDSTHELEGCLYTLHAVLDPSSSHPPVTLRLAVHVPIGEMFEQVTEYIGVSPRPGRIGRRFPANAGIIGKAYRENAVLVARRLNDDYELYLEELIRDWSFTADQARRLNPAAMEWMAVPLYDTEHGRVDAVLYLDASKRNFFTPSRQELVLLAASGIAVFIGKRYS